MSEHSTFSSAERRSDCPIAASVIQAQQKAITLLAKVEQRGLIIPGKTERALSDEVFALAEELFGIKKYWHKRIVRTGANTVHSYPVNPPDTVIAEDDILFFDFGPIFEGFEADFGRTVVLGEDPEKHRLNHDLLPIFEEAKAFYLNRPEMAGAELFTEVVRLTESKGWRYGGPHCGHLVGAFPHEVRCGEVANNYIRPENTMPMNTPEANGDPRYWILEIHLVHPQQSFGGFYEDLLNL